MCLILLGMMKTTILYTLYDYNRATFIEMFCLNKDRPQFNCDGKCKLAEMQKEENEKRAHDLLKQLQLDVVYFSPIKPVNLTGNQLLCLSAKMPFSYGPDYSFLFTSRSVKPPEMLRA